MTPAKASKPFMKLTGPEAMPPPERVSLLPRSVEKFVPVPEPHLKSMPSVRVRPMIDSMLSCTELMKHAEHCGFDCTPTLKPDGRVEGHLLLNQKVRELVFECIARGAIGKIAAFDTPTNDGAHNAANQLAHRAFAFGTAGLAVKIFAGDNVGRGLRPTLGNLYVVLPKNRGALFIADQGCALLPFNRIEWSNPAVVKKRLNTNPACACKVSGAPACTALPCSTDFTVAIPSLQALGSHRAWWDAPLFYSSAVAEVMRVHRAANLFDPRMREIAAAGIRIISSTK